MMTRVLGRGAAWGSPNVALQCGASALITTHKLSQSQVNAMISADITRALPSRNDVGKIGALVTFDDLEGEVLPDTPPLVSVYSVQQQQRGAPAQVGTSAKCSSPRRPVRTPFINLSQPQSSRRAGAGAAPRETAAPRATRTYEERYKSIVEEDALRRQLRGLSEQRTDEETHRLHERAFFSFLQQSDMTPAGARKRSRDVAIAEQLAWEAAKRDFDYWLDLPQARRRRFAADDFPSRRRAAAYLAEEQKRRATPLAGRIATEGGRRV